MKKLIASVLLSMCIAGGAFAQQAAPAPAAQQQARPSPQDVDPNSMVMAALQAAQLVDGGRAGEIWDGSSAIAKRAITKDAFVKAITAARNPLGQPVSRVWLSVIRQSVPAPQAGQAAPAGSPPPGNYISVRFATRFSGGRTVAELVTFRLEDSGTWRVAGYTIQ